MEPEPAVPQSQAPLGGGDRALEATAVQALANTLRHAELMANGNRDAILVIRCADGRIVDANAAAVGTYGYRREELLALRLHNLRMAADHGELLAQMSGITDGLLFETRHCRKDGSTFPVEVSTRAVEVDGMRLLVSNIRDITARRASEEQIRLLQTAAETAVNGIVITDAAGQATWVNRAFLAMNGYEAGEILGRKLNRLQSGQQSPEFYAAMWQTLRRGERWSGDLINRRKNGTLYDVSMTISPVGATVGSGAHFIAIQEDITARKQAERQVRQSHARLAQLNLELERLVGERTRELGEARTRFEDIFEASPVGVCITRRSDRQFLNVNPAYAAMFGYAVPEMVGRTVFELNVYGSDANAALFMAAMDQARHIRNYEARAQKKSGQVFDILVAAEEIQVEAVRGLLMNTVDITERNRTRALLEHYSQELENLYNLAPCGYHTLDDDGIVLRMNDTELRWLGYAREEVLGHPLTEFFSPAGRAAFARGFAALKAEKSISNVHIEYQRKDGTVFPALINSVAEMDAAGNFIQNRTTVFDNTERMGVHRKLRQALASVAAANRSNSEFLANMSHEIRTPMNAIMGHAQLLLRDPALPGDLRNQAQTIHRSSEALLSLLNGILDLSRLEAGQLPLQPEVFSLPGLCQELTTLFCERAQAKQITLTASLGPELPEFIEADPGKLRQAVANLLSNAIKFTRQGGVELCVASVAPAPGELWLVVEVKDTGPGIAAAELDELFGRFEQTSSGRATGVGSGLGLHLSQGYARLMGGELTARSEPGVGSVFQFKVPVKRAALPALAPRPQGGLVLRSGAGLPEYRVLVVDDLADNCELLRLVLARVGFAVQLAATGWEALQINQAWHPQLILMDARMPGLDGFETIRRLRARDGAQPRIIMVSASAYAEDHRLALAAGANDFLAKPIRERELLEHISAQLGCEYETLAVPAAEPTAAPEFTPETVGQLPAELRQAMRTALVVGDFETVSSLLQTVRQLRPALGAALQDLAAEYNAEELLRLFPEP